MSLPTSTQNLRLLGSLTVTNDSTMSGCGDAVRDYESLLNYLLAAADMIENDQPYHTEEEAETSFHIPSEPDILHGRSRITPPIRYDVCIYAHKIVINKWLC